MVGRRTQKLRSGCLSMLITPSSFSSRFSLPHSAPAGGRTRDPVKGQPPDSLGLPVTAARLNIATSCNREFLRGGLRALHASNFPEEEVESETGTARKG